MKPEYRKMFSKEDAIPHKVITAIFKGHEDFLSAVRVDIISEKAV